MICIACQNEYEATPETCASCAAPLLYDGRLRAIRRLGGGGALATFEASDETAGRQVALRVADVSALGDWSELEAFDRRGDLVAHLDHPAFPKLLGHFELTLSSQTYRCQEETRAPGESLARQIASGRHFDDASTRRILDQALDAVAYLHGFSPAVVHGEVDSSHLIIGPNDAVSLVGFAAARDATPSDPTAPTPAADLRELGVTMVEALTRAAVGSLASAEAARAALDACHVSAPVREVLRELLTPPAPDAPDPPDARALRQRLAPPEAPAFPDLARLASEGGTVETSSSQVTITRRSGEADQIVAFGDAPDDLMRLALSAVESMQRQPGAGTLPPNRRGASEGGTVETSSSQVTITRRSGEADQIVAFGDAPDDLMGAALSAVESMQRQPGAGTLPPNRRDVPPSPERRPRRSALTLIALLVLALGALGTIGFVLFRGPSHDPLSAVGVAAEAPPAGTRAAVWRPTQTQLARAPVVWATSSPEASSSYQPDQWGAPQAAGPPNVWPGLDDDPHAWAPKNPNDGTEWIDLRWNEPVRANGIVIAETLHPGAVVRVEDRAAGHPTEVWSGSAPTKSATAGALLWIPLQGRPRISKLRVVLDTTLMAGWSEIDAVGLWPAGR